MIEKKGMDPTILDQRVEKRAAYGLCYGFVLMGVGFWSICRLYNICQ